MCGVDGWSDTAAVEWIAADLRAARANHERAGRPAAVRILGRMAAWMEAHSSELKRTAGPPRHLARREAKRAYYAHYRPPK